MQNLDQIARDAETAFAATSDPDTLEQIKARFLELARAKKSGAVRR